jgi:hypothetical protein
MFAFVSIMLFKMPQYVDTKSCSIRLPLNMIQFFHRSLQILGALFINPNMCYVIVTSRETLQLKISFINDVFSNTYTTTKVGCNLLA